MNKEYTDLENSLVTKLYIDMYLKGLIGSNLACLKIEANPEGDQVVHFRDTLDTKISRAINVEAQIPKNQTDIIITYSTILFTGQSELELLRFVNKYNQSLKEVKIAYETLDETKGKLSCIHYQKGRLNNFDYFMDNKKLVAETMTEVLTYLDKEENIK